MKIKFLADREVNDGSGRLFKAGQVIELPYASARHWLTRNVAIIVIEDAAGGATCPPVPATKKRKLRTFA